MGGLIEKRSATYLGLCPLGEGGGYGGTDRGQASVLVRGRPPPSTSPLLARGTRVSLGGKTQTNPKPAPLHPRSDGFPGWGGTQRQRRGTPSRRKPSSPGRCFRRSSSQRGLHSRMGSGLTLPLQPSTHLGSACFTGGGAFHPQRSAYTTVTQYSFLAEEQPMSWEQRGSRRYYYRVRRGPNGPLVKTYVGTGPAAQRAADEDNYTRALRPQAPLAQHQVSHRERPLTA